MHVVIFSKICCVIFMLQTAGMPNILEIGSRGWTYKTTHDDICISTGCVYTHPEVDQHTPGAGPTRWEQVVLCLSRHAGWIIRRV